MKKSSPKRGFGFQTAFLTSDICPGPFQHLWIPLEGAAVLADNAIVAETARSHPKPLLVQPSHQLQH